MYVSGYLEERQDYLSMDSGVKALLIGCTVFIVVTSVDLLLDGDRSRIDALTIGVLTGGATALSTLIAAWRNAAQSDATSY